MKEVKRGGRREEGGERGERGSEGRGQGGGEKEKEA